MTVSGGIVEFYAEGARLPLTTGAAIIEGRLVEYTGDRTVGPAAADSSKVAGVALQSSSAAGDVVAIATDGVWPCRASGAITAGATLKAAAAGDVTVWAITDDADEIVGRALEDITSGQSGRVKLSL